MRGLGIIVNPNRIAVSNNQPATMADETSECPPHHWIVEEPQGKEYADGKCKKCGKTTHYKTWIEQLDYIPSLLQE